MTKTPWELERHKKRVAAKRSHPPYKFPAHFFEKLPKQVYDCIVVQLEQIHLRKDHACPSCYLRDFHSLVLTSRAWDKAATAGLYRKIPVLVSEEHTKLPKLKIKGTTRLKLLRRTLREHPALARLVRELHLSDIHALYEDASIEREEIVNLVASLVMAAPYLERLVGFHIPYTNTFDRLSHALSTRRNLKDRLWLLADTSPDYRGEEDEMANYYHAACDPTERFLELNSSHPSLSTLILHQDANQGSDCLNFRAIVGTIRSCPSLRDLSISGLATISFSNLTLNTLPSGLQSLRLEDLPGITEKGLRRFFAAKQATSIMSLTLINLDVRNLVTVSEILSTQLCNLRTFSFVQEKAPILVGRESVPDFHSSLLRKLHWEFRSEAGPLPTLRSESTANVSASAPFPFTSSEPICCLATSLLAASIRDGAFPSLRRIRIPHDPQGVIQDVCKPLATALLPSDGPLYATPARILSSNGFAITVDNQTPLLPKVRNFSAIAISSGHRTDYVVASPTSIGGFAQSELTPKRSRLAAQARIVAARHDAGVSFRLFDPEGELRVEKAIGGYIGQIGSMIEYNLKADRDEYCQTWITGVHDLMGSCDSENAATTGHRLGSCGHIVERSRYNVAMIDDLFG